MPLHTVPTAVDCHPDAVRITERLGFSCTDADPVITLRAPWELSSWTQPVLELLVVTGAVLALLHAVRRLRGGDPTNLALWLASLVYLLVVEPPLYFPEWFGIREYVGFNFAHNVFSVQLMYDRLPLYIVAIYPAMSQLSYELVRRYGVFARRGALLGGVAVAFVNQVFYEVFDQLGPQLEWWAWNTENPDNRPLLDSVPVNSIWIFASVVFGVMAALVHALVARPTAAGRPPRGAGLAWRVVVTGVGAAVAMPVFALTTAVLGREESVVTAKAVVLAVEITALWVAGTAILLREWRAGTPAHEERTAFDVFPAVYLVVLAALWLAALPAHVAAEGGTTDSGTPTGNLPYTLACFAVATLVLVGLARRDLRTGARADRSEAARPGR